MFIDDRSERIEHLFQQVGAIERQNGKAVGSEIILFARDERILPLKNERRRRQAISFRVRFGGRESPVSQAEAGGPG